jgi:hypothetical protein
MLTRSDIDKKIAELAHDASVRSGGFHLKDITAGLAKFLEEHGYPGNVRRSAAMYVRAYDRAHLR